MSEIKADELQHIAYMQTLEIQKLNARIAELEAERRWIPVSERLPEKDGYYLVSDDHGDIMSCEFLADYKGEPIWDVAGVLYWMPLPEPPEMAEDAWRALVRRACE